MDIEVGEYVRIAGGIIAKVTNKNNDCILTNAVIKDPMRQDGTIRDWAIFNDEKRLITKHSKNIIDLIEVGDYVNGMEVVDVMAGFSEGTMEIKLSNKNKIYRNYIKDIKTILTHEMYEANCYRLEEKE